MGRVSSAVHKVGQVHVGTCFVSYDHYIATRVGIYRNQLPREGSQSMSYQMSVEIVDVGPRDGLQNEDSILSVQERIALIESLVSVGVGRVEAVSFVNPKRVPQMADAEGVLAGLSRDVRDRAIGLVLNDRGLQRALAASVPEINFVIVSTDSFARANQGMTTDELIEQWRTIAPIARANGLRTSLTVAAAFGCPFDGPVAQSHVLEVIEKAFTVPPDELALADTIGAASPGEVRSLVRSVRSLVPQVVLRCHFHNTRNAGLANAWVAVEEGVRVLDASVGGIGGCPFAPRATGNIATEDVVWMLERSGVSTGVDLERLLELPQYLEEKLKKPVPSMLSRAGVFP